MNTIEIIVRIHQKINKKAPFFIQMPNPHICLNSEENTY